MNEWLLNMKKKHLLFVSILIVLAFGGCGPTERDRTVIREMIDGATAQKGAQEKVQAIRKAMIDEAYCCVFTEIPVTVDGLLTEAVWSRAKLTPFVTPMSLEKPISKTEAWMAYDKDYLYVAFKAYDRDIWGLVTERDSGVSGEDVLEVFFKTHPARDPYFNFEMNIRGAVTDAFNVKRNAAVNYKRWSQWDCAGLKMASTFKGTVNDWKDEDEFWILEAAIPFAEIPTLAGRSPARGDQWLFTLSRIDYSIYLPDGRETSASAPITVQHPPGAFHWYEDWRKLIFE